MAFEFNENFQKFLQREFQNENHSSYQLLQSAKKLDESSMDNQFPGRSRRWLLQELNRWKKRIQSSKSPPVQGTLLNLQIVCNLTGLTPNQILTPKITTKNPQLLTFPVLMDLKKLILMHTEEKKWDFFIPIIYDEQSMLFGFLQVYETFITNKKNVFFRFWNFQIKTLSKSSDSYILKTVFKKQ